METGLSFFKTRVAKRIFILFLLCAMLPITVFSYLSFSQVSAQLKDQSMRRIQNNTKSYGLILFERFVFLELELDMFGSAPLTSSKSVMNPESGIPGDLKKQGHMIAVAFVTGKGETQHLYGKMNRLPMDLKRMENDNTLSGTRVMF